MKRFSIIVLGALAMIMAGCSKDVHTASKEPVNDDWLVNLELPVPIQFGSGSIQTKASFDSMDDLLTTGSNLHSFGVFAIDKDAEKIEDENLLLNHQRAFYLLNETTGEKEFTLVRSGTNGIYPEPKYYPMVSNTSYDFYSYYARKNESELDKTTDTKLLVNVQVGSHKDDILWAKATTGEDKDGYHAKYIRQNPTSKPTFEFKHVTSCLRFRAVYAPTDENETESKMESIYISSIKFLNLHKTAQLCIMDLDDPANESKLTVTGTPVAITDKDVVVETKHNIVVVDEKTGKYEPFLLCDDFFIAPQDEVLEAEFVINYKPVGGTEMSQTVIYKLNPAALGAKKNEQGQVVDEEGNPIRLFEAGYWYGFNIKIYSPEEIKIDVSLSDYNQAFGTEDGYNENNENLEDNLIFG